MSYIICVFNDLPLVKTMYFKIVKLKVNLHMGMCVCIHMWTYMVFYPA